MENFNNMSDAELLSDFRHIETQLRSTLFKAEQQKNIFHTQGTLISEIVRLSQAAKPGDETSNLKRALTSFIKL